MPRVVHFEIHAPDAQKAIDFYRDVFDWEFNQFEGGEWEYHLATTGKDQPGIDGGLMPSRDGQPRVVNTIQVEDVDAYATKVAEHGGQIIVPKFSIPGVGYVAYCTDPGGVIFGIMHGDPGAGQA